MKTLFTILLVITMFSFLAVPAVVLAQGGADHQLGNDSGSGSSAGGTTSLDNPLGTNDPRVIVGNIIEAVLGLVGSIALLVFILGGLSWVTSAGSEEKVKKGKEMIIWASLGLIVIFTSYTLVGFVLDALTGG